MFPWQIKSILTQTPPAVFLHHITQSRNRHAISKPRCSHHSCERHARLVFFVQNSTPPNGILLAFHPAGYLNYEELFFILRKLLLDGTVRAFRVVCCVYTIADFRSAGTSFSRNAVLRERNAESPYSKVKIGSSRVRRSSFCRNSGRLLRNRHEKIIKKGLPDRKPFHFAILRPVRM